MDAGKRLINDIFNGNRLLEIPFFQRSYVWDEPQWERFLQDMEEVSSSNRPRFLGSIILKQQSTNSESGVGDLRILIDGQQRLTTLAIFLKVLCAKTTQNGMFDRIFKLLHNDRIALTHNHNDLMDFEKIVNLSDLQPIVGATKIVHAYNYFCENIHTEKLNIQNILAKVIFVGIDINADEEEQQIFDTINSLGVKLTTGELLKNYFFDKNSLKDYEQKWKPIFEADNECREYWDKEITAGRIKRPNLELFFYSFLQIKLQYPKFKVTTEDKNEYGRFEGLFNSYKSFISKYGISKKDIINEIREYATIYRDNIDLDILNREVPAKAGIERMNVIIFALETSTVIPYILYVLKEADPQEQQKIFSYLEAYLMRRLICRANNKNYNNLFSEALIYNQTLTEASLQEYFAGQEVTVNRIPKDDEMNNGFHEGCLTNKQSAGVLYMIESKIRNRASHSTALLGVNSYSLEHLMPKKWENNWGHLTGAEAINNRNRTLLTLGNLAIITASLNSSIRDANWLTKKTGKGLKSGLWSYAAGIETLHRHCPK